MKSHFLSFLDMHQSDLILMLRETAKENGMELFWLNSEELGFIFIHL